MHDGLTTGPCIDTRVAPQPKVSLIADELKGWAERDTRQHLQQLAQQLVEPQQQKLVAAMLGL